MENQKSTREVISEYVEKLGTILVAATDDVETNNGKGEYSKLDLFDVNGLRDFYETILKLEQWDDSFEGDYAFKKRLVKVNKFLDVVTREEHKDMLIPHVIRGLFLELEVCLIPKRFVKIGKARKGISSVEVLIPPSNPESLGLPGNNEVLWGTIREVDSNYYAAISCRNEQAWLKNWITRASSWEYVRVE